MIIGSPLPIQKNHEELSGAAPSAFSREKELVSLAQGGDQRAFQSLIEKISPAMLRNLRVKIWNQSDVEDLYMVIIEKAWSAIGNFRGECAFATWVYTIMSSEVNNYRRRVARSNEIFEYQLPSIGEDKEDPVEDFVDSKTLLPDRAAISSESFKAIEGSLGRLTQEFRDILAAREALNTVGEVADLLKIPKGTAGSRLLYARRALEHELNLQGCPVPRWGRSKTR